MLFLTTVSTVTLRVINSSSKVPSEVVLEAQASRLWNVSRPCGSGRFPSKAMISTAQRASAYPCTWSKANQRIKMTCQVMV
jgi:hypothetical protein